MELTRESARRRWLIMASIWAAVATISFWHTEVMRDYVALLDGIGQPAAAHATPLGRPVPGSFVDGQNWMRYALAAQASGQWQVRFTHADNAPNGREVHWNSLLVHLIGLAGRIQQASTGGTLTQATENAFAWFNLPLFFGCVVVFSSWAAVRAGAGAGFLVAIGFIGITTFYEGFTPNYVDHHGLLTAAVFGTVLGSIFMGIGWYRPAGDTPSLLPVSHPSARRGAIASAVCAGVGMWISAASTIPAIAFVGIAGLGATIVTGGRLRREGATFEPGIWRLWGVTGAVLSLFFYAIEYAPAHLGLRLEVNHPFFAGAWWGGSEVVALLAIWHFDRKTGRPAARKWILPACAIAAAPVTVLLKGAAVFAVLDPFVGDLRHTVGEGMSFAAAVRAFGNQYAQPYLIDFIIMGAAAWLLIAVKRNRLLLLFSALVGLGFLVLACMEIRWWVVGSGPMLCLVLVMVAAVGAGWKPLPRWLLILGIAGLILPSGAIEAARTLRKNINRKLADPADLMQPVYRDIAAKLRANQPKGDIVLLASPDASNSISYYGGFSSLGTLYWENTEGLKAAAAIHCAERDDEALALIKARGVTHVVMVSQGNFIAEYFRLWRPTAPPADVEKTFAHRLLVQQQVPRWLRAIAYRAPIGNALPNFRVLLFQVIPDQTDLEACWYLARAQLELGNHDDAERLFRMAINLGNPEQRGQLLQIAADLAVGQRAPAVAARLYRDGIAQSPTAKGVAEYAWLLSSTSDPTVHNGREALALVEPAAKANPNDALLLNSYASALADNGRFTEAVAVAERTVALLRSAGDTNATAIMQQRLEAYRANRAWRQ